MVLILKKIPLFFLLIVPAANLHAQNYHDSSLVNNIYKNTIGVNLPLFTGKEYIDYNHAFTGNPFFESLYFTKGNVVYNGIEYAGIQLLYDLLHEDVVIKNYNDTPLILVREKITSFTIDGHYFEQVFADSSSAENKVSGFIDVLYNGEVKFAAKRKKTIKQKPVGQSFETYFIQTDKYFIFKNDVYYPVDSKSSALKILSDKKTELSKFIHQHKLKFKKDKEASMVKLVQYYDGLNTAK